MSDVRLTATNPDDSSVVPVACNAKGELKLEEPIAPPEFDGNLDGDLTVSGRSYFGDNTYIGDRDLSSATASGTALFPNGLIGSQWAGNAATNQVALRLTRGISPAGDFFKVLASGKGSFAGDLVVGSRSKHWMLVEQGGLCHMVEQVKATTADLVDPAADADEYPKLRDVFAELNVIEKALEEVMEKLRMTQPDGWPVWDGSDNS